LAHDPLHARENSNERKYINQSIEIIDAMENCSVAVKVGLFGRELLTFLLSEESLSKRVQRDETISESLSGSLFNEFTSFIPGFLTDNLTDRSATNFFEEGLLDFMLQ
jgi:hypothetical protein